MTLLPVVVFALTYLLIATRRLAVLPIGRPAGALLGAVLMVAVGGLTPADALGSVDGDTILLLFSMMALAAYLEKSGWLQRLGGLAIRACRTPAALLVLTGWVPGLLSAFLLNDSICLFLTPVVLEICGRAKLPYGPFLVALATSANIGSAATLVGNPQNMIVGSQSGYGFVAFLAAVGPAALVGLALNSLLLLAFYRRRLPPVLVGVPDRTAPPPTDQGGARSTLTAVVIVGVVAGLLAGMHMGFTVLAGVMVLVVADRREPKEAFERIDWSLLVFFACLFAVVEGLDRTGLVEQAWVAARPAVSLTEPGGVAALAGVLTVGSNVVSNVPLVLLAGPYLATLGEPERAWALLGFVTTVAGNLTLVGSVANLIVVEQARRCYHLGFFEYLRFGAVSTLLVLAAGIPIVWWMTG